MKCGGGAQAEAYGSADVVVIKRKNTEEWEDRCGGAGRDPRAVVTLRRPARCSREICARRVPPQMQMKEKNSHGSGWKATIR